MDAGTALDALYAYVNALWERECLRCRWLREHTTYSDTPPVCDPCWRGRARRTPA